MTVSVVIKFDKELIKNLLAMKKKEEISEAQYTKVRSLGAQVI